MKKRKTYEISVIDKTYSKTISDETKFYTSDTALELVFKLKETEYTFESAEIVLLNENDKSLITRRVVKSDEGFVYEFEKEIIAHYGEWKAQLMLIENGEAHVSSPIKFRIENDLYTTKPQALSDVVSWVNLKLYAEKLVGEFKQVVDAAIAKNVEIENTFKVNEQSRQTTFEHEESERNQTFESNELTRKTQELERENAETNRQSVFDENEAIRTETFNTNEATRKANEEARELAENERENAEGQRKIDHANRSSEFDGKADKVVIKNLVENGDFSKGFDGWEVKGDVQNIGGRVKLVRLTGNPLASLSYQDREIFESRNDVYYMLVQGELINRLSGSDGVMINDTVNVMPVWMLQSQPKGVVSNSSIVFNLSSNNTPYVYANTVGGSEYFIDNIIIVNLTKTFGKGNEPTKEEMDELIKVTGYIDSEYALNNKEMLIWKLALIRRNKNAIVALGGTI